MESAEKFDELNKNLDKLIVKIFLKFFVVTLLQNSLSLTKLLVNMLNYDYKKDNNLLFCTVCILHILRIEQGKYETCIENRGYCSTISPLSILLVEKNKKMLEKLCKKINANDLLQICEI